MKLLYKFNFVKFQDLEKPKYPDGFITHYIIDDMIGTNIFKNGRSLFTNLCIRNRHITPSKFIISTQSMMMTPKTIILNANLNALFKFANKNTIFDDIYPTMSAFITEEQFKILYDYATEESYNALVIDATEGKPIFKKNFESISKIN
jgi:hypothetical protein